MKAILIKNDTQERIEVHSTTRHPRSRHGVPVWVDSDGIAYCKVGKPSTAYAIKLNEEDETRLRIGTMLAQARRQRRITIRQLESYTGISNSNISKIERGDYNVSIDILAKLCSAVGAEIEIKPMKKLRKPIGVTEIVI